MKNATRVSILFSLLVPLGLVVHASDAPWVIAQGGLPGQLPGQKPPGQLPGPSSLPSKPATAALPSAGAALPSSPCCSITAINKTMGVVTAREKRGGRTIEIKATPAQLQNLRVGQDIFANLETKQASLDGKTICCGLVFVAATPSPAAPATTLSSAPQTPTKQPAPTKTASADPIKSGSSPTATGSHQLPGKAPLGAPQLPGKTPEPSRSALPAKTAGGVLGLPATGMTSPTPATSTPVKGRVVPPSACCSIAKIDKATGMVTAKGSAAARMKIAKGAEGTFEFNVADSKQLQGLRVGQGVYANLATGEVSIDGKTMCCKIKGAGTGAGMVSRAANVHHVSHSLGLKSIGVHSPLNENTKDEADPSPPKAHKNVPLQGPGKRQQRLADTEEGKKLIQQGAKMLGGITMHASLLGEHKYMVNDCLGIKVSAGNFDLRIPDPDVRFENNAVRISFVIQRISMNALSVRLRPDLGDWQSPCTFGSRIGVGGYAENIRYDITFDPVQDLEACRLGSMGKVEFKYSVGKVRLEPLPPEVGNLAKDMINDALMFISSNTNLNLVDEEMLILNRLLAQKCPTRKLKP